MGLELWLPLREDDDFQWTPAMVWDDDFLNRGYPPGGNNPGGFHYAQDFGCPENTVVQLCERSRIKRIDHSPSGAEGRCLIVVGAFTGWSYRYLHLESFGGIKEGRLYNAGYAVARSGNTGNSNEPHLHLEASVLNTGSWEDREPRVNLRPFLRDAFAYGRK